MTISGADLPWLPLNNGTKIPPFGMGCWMGEAGGGKVVEDMVTSALKVGYRHFDTVRVLNALLSGAYVVAPMSLMVQAAGYDNEEHVGAAIRKSGIPREDIYVTTKLWFDHGGRVRERFDESFEKLGLEYIDLYLMHWPFVEKDERVLPPDESPTLIDTYKEMEKLLETGKVKSIGVSNFSTTTLNRLLPHCKVIPVTNQVEVHPYLPQHGLQKFCESHGILVTAYSPLGQPPSPEKQKAVPALFSDATVTALSKKYTATNAQVLISWCIQRGLICISKSANLERMKNNFTLLKLDDADMQILNNLHKEPGKHRQLIIYQSSKPREAFGAKYEWLGWNRDAEGNVLDDE
ncbi:hypothetical protein EWM64_g2852 [Hericium alpestre]|uniref:NADP-dependent oxidoreductase domain-containing protein n=1 Tax=Hericium alpestre TaxID=135208 RepID=A0A4Z0A288_9AGAM|nr:hypothetical protein EWM64_g2852 [Hericium alpestre]